jgi:tetratricopeptide (TPR) repeat protein
MRMGDITLACDLARQAIDDGLSDPVLFSLRSYWHEQSGRFLEAAADLVQADMLSPCDPRTLSALSRCLAGAHQLKESLAASEAAIALDPGLARAHYNRANAQEQLKRLNEAEISYAKAAQMDPTMQDAFQRVAGLAARRGKNTEARSWAQRALALDPGDSKTYATLIRCDLNDRRFVEADRAAQYLLRRKDLPIELRGSVLIHKADALDGQDRTAEAFNAYTEGNCQIRSLAQAQFEKPGCERPLSLIGSVARGNPARCTRRVALVAYLSA